MTTLKIVGVINATPDSFSDGGKFQTPSSAIAHARNLMSAGADLLDLGGESTRPGSKPLGAEAELARVLPICVELAPQFPLAIDTYKASVAAACLKAGAMMINDVSALRADPDLAPVVRDHRVKLVLMYSSLTAKLPHAIKENRKEFSDVVSEIAEFLISRVEFAISQGIAAENIILDPGCGVFISSNPEYSWELLRRFAELVERVKPFPVYLGVSRKGFLGGKLEDRDPLSQLTALSAIERGASYIRTHNPQMMREFWDAQAKLR